MVNQLKDLSMILLPTQEKEGTVKINPSKIIVVEGILIFAVPEIREFLG